MTNPIKYVLQPYGLHPTIRKWFQTDKLSMVRPHFRILLKKVRILSRTDSLIRQSHHLIGVGETFTSVCLSQISKLLYDKFKKY